MLDFCSDICGILRKAKLYWPRHFRRPFASQTVADHGEHGLAWPSVADHPLAWVIFVDVIAKVTYKNLHFLTNQMANQMADQWPTNLATAASLLPSKPRPNLRPNPRRTPTNPRPMPSSSANICKTHRRAVTAKRLQYGRPLLG